MAAEKGSKMVNFAIFERFSGADARLFVTEYLASATEYLASATNYLVSAINNLASATEYLASAINNLASAPEYLVSGINNLVSATNYLGCGGNNLGCLLENLVEEADRLPAGAGWRYGLGGERARPAGRSRRRPCRRHLRCGINSGVNGQGSRMSPARGRAGLQPGRLRSQNIVRPHFCADAGMNRHIIYSIRNRRLHRGAIQAWHGT